MDALEQATQLIHELQQKNDDLSLELEVANGLRSTATARALAHAADVTEAAAAEALKRGLRIQRREYQSFLQQKLRAMKAQQDRLMKSMHQNFKEQIENMARQQRRARSGSGSSSLGLDGVSGRRRSSGSGSGIGNGIGGRLGLPLAENQDAEGTAADTEEGDQANQLAHARYVSELEKKVREGESNTKRLQDNAESLCTQLTSTATRLQATESRLKELEEQHAKLVRWQIVDYTQFRGRTGQGTVYDARIQDVLKSWTPDEQRIARLTSWLDGITRGKVSDSSFPRRIELLAMSQRAASGFLTKVVPLLAVHVDLTIALRPSHGQTLDIDTFLQYCAAVAKQSASGGGGARKGSIFSRGAAVGGGGATSPRSEAAVASLLQLKLDLRFVVIGASATAPKQQGSIGLDI